MEDANRISSDNQDNFSLQRDHEWRQAVTIIKKKYKKIIR